MIPLVKELSFINAPYAFHDICLIYPIQIGTIIRLGKEYDKQIMLLTLSRAFIQRHYKEKKIKIEDNKYPTPLTFLLIQCKYDREFLVELEHSFYTFIKEKVTILPDMGYIVVGDPCDKRFITEENFDEFQNIIRIQNHIPIVEEIPKDESPMAKKFREKREMRDAVKARQEGATAPKLVELMSALCVYNTGVTPFNIKDLSLYAFRVLLNTAGAQERYDTEMHYIYGGADPKKVKPEYWIKNNNI